MGRRQNPGHDLKNTRFNLTGKTEREFELAFMSSVSANRDRINCAIHSQVDRDTIGRCSGFVGEKSIGATGFEPAT
ncbi:hypothetical protein [Vulcanococcus sp.]|jgi:hypothetical protein|uniref:hypothetical protein n=1 Tax=Vulcanococcus sp. TaxID=2856995 RepID=UPI0037D9AFAC